MSGGGLHLHPARVRMLHVFVPIFNAERGRLVEVIVERMDGLPPLSEWIPREFVPLLQYVFPGVPTHITPRLVS